MKIKHYLYNAFIIESGKSKIAIDPGQNLWIFKLGSLIPKGEWSDTTHIIVTHADPDHYWHTDKIAEISNATVFCSKELVKIENGKSLLIHPRKGGLKFGKAFNHVIPMNAGDEVTIDQVIIQAIKTKHGPLAIPFFGKQKKQYPGPNERAGFGSMGFKITADNKTIVNLGDSLLLKEWEGLKPDILMLPIGGAGNNTWTMDVSDALEAVRTISPKIVIPCHYNNSFFWIKNINPADNLYFKSEVEKMGKKCHIMQYGDEIEV